MATSRARARAARRLLSSRRSGRAERCRNEKNMRAQVVWTGQWQGRVGAPRDIFPSRFISGKDITEMASDDEAMQIEKSAAHAPDNRAEMIYFGHGAPDQERSSTALRTAEQALVINAAMGRGIKLDGPLQEGARHSNGRR
eukprot:703827-Pyramimonas_sp.AAC.1